MNIHRDMTGRVFEETRGGRHFAETRSGYARLIKLDDTLGVETERTVRQYVESGILIYAYSIPFVIKEDTW